MKNQWLDMIDVCGVQATEIFDDFLDYIKETPLKLQKTPVDTLIKSGVSMAEGRRGFEDIQIIQEVQPDLFVEADASKLKRVIMNLVSNAVDVLADHKVINPLISIKAYTLKNHVIIMIKDNGPGIPEKIINNLFDAFITSGKSNGTGLGLAIVKQYIEAHNGTIKVANNNGAQFTIELPVAV